MKLSSLAGKALVPTAMLLLGLCFGCSSYTTDLRLLSNDQQHSFDQAFGKAYISRDMNGDSNIVLIADGQGTPTQLVHIRVFWTPKNGTKPDHPANTNAAIRWCFLGQNPSDVLVYSGSGLVMVSDSVGSADVTIRRAWMKPTYRHGNMADPMGPSMLDGTAYAQRDPEQVLAVMTQIRAIAPVSVAVQAPPAEPANLSVKP